ncbi:unnamed protein product [Allacma fusca]|uniref:Retrotransposon gag domain-containing protein n=1 Tax=Allacma fusca TaxID=39272 RepID=A0A8J2J8S8_9HEXA|nr:unnamed protein product [Allacma fusca]
MTTNTTTVVVNTAPIHSIVQFKKLNQFDPTCHDINDFVLDIERVVAQYTWDWPTLQGHMPNVLVRDPCIWYQAEIAKQPPTITDIPSFYRIFKDHYVKDRTVYLNQLKTRSQKEGESCAKFLYDIDYICTRYNPSMSNEDKVAWVIEGLLPHLKAQAAGYSYTSMAALVRFCEQKELAAVSAPATTAEVKIQALEEKIAKLGISDAPNDQVSFANNRGQGGRG